LRPIPTDCRQLRLSDGNEIKPAAEMYAPMEETLFQPPKASGLSAGSDDQQITIQLGYDGCEQ
jgi:hypothetical protein